MNKRRSIIMKLAVAGATLALMAPVALTTVNSNSASANALQSFEVGENEARSNVTQSSQVATNAGGTNSKRSYHAQSSVPAGYHMIQRVNDAGDLENIWVPDHPYRISKRHRVRHAKHINNIRVRPYHGRKATRRGHHAHKPIRYYTRKHVRRHAWKYHIRNRRIKRTRRVNRNPYAITRKAYNHDMRLVRKYRGRIHRRSRKLHKARWYQKRDLRRQIRVDLRKLNRLPL